MADELALAAGGFGFDPDTTGGVPTRLGLLGAECRAHFRVDGYLFPERGKGQLFQPRVAGHPVELVRHGNWTELATKYPLKAQYFAWLQVRQCGEQSAADRGDLVGP